MGNNRNRNHRNDRRRGPQSYYSEGFKEGTKSAGKTAGLGLLIGAGAYLVLRMLDSRKKN